MSAISWSMSSREPASSPTAIIWITTGVKMPAAIEVRSTLSPRSTPSRIRSMRSATKALSTVWATLERAWITGTPLLEARAKLRAKRARVALSTILPAMGTRSLNLSQA